LDNAARRSPPAFSFRKVSTCCTATGGRYELDIVARKEGVLHIVEVKSRKADGLTAPEEAMTRKKFNALFRAAQQYVALYRIDADTQFDLIAVDLLPDSTHRLRYIPNAMVPRW